VLRRTLEPKKDEVKSAYNEEVNDPYRSTTIGPVQERQIRNDTARWACGWKKDGMYNGFYCEELLKIIFLKGRGVNDGTVLKGISWIPVSCWFLV
jgi:hypothetical protein